MFLIVHLVLIRSNRPSSFDPIQSSSSSAFIGWEETGNTPARYRFKGMMHHFEVYNRSLSSNEIQQLYPLTLQGVSQKEAIQRAEEVLNKVFLEKLRLVSRGG